MRWLKIAALISTLLVAVVVALLGAVHFANLTEYRRVLADILTTLAEQDVQLEGQLNIDLGFTTLIESERACVGSAPWDDAGDLLCADQLHVRLDLRDLLDGWLIIEQLTARALDVRVRRDDSGRLNWQRAPESDAAPVAQDEAPVDVLLYSARVETVSLSYDDPQRAAPLELTVAGFSVRPDARDMLLVEGEGDMQGWRVVFDGEVGPWASLATGVDLQAALQGRIDDAEVRVRGTAADLAAFEGIELAFHVADPGSDLATRILGQAPLWRGDFSASGTVLRNQGINAIETQVTAGVHQLRASGGFPQTGTWEGARTTFELNGATLTEFDPRLPETAYRLGGELTAEADGLELTGLAFEVAELTGGGGGGVKWTGEYAGGVRIGTTSLGETAGRFGYVLRPVPAELTAELRGDGRRIEFSNALLRVRGDEVAFEGFFEPAAPEASVSVDARIEDLAAVLGDRLPYTPPPDTAMRANGALHWQGANVTAERLRIAVGLSRMEIDGVLSEGMTRPLAFTLTTPDLSQLGAISGVDLAPLAVDGRATLHIEDTTLVLNELDLRVDDNHLLGRGRITPGDPLRVEADLRAPVVDLRPLFPDEDDETAPASSRKRLIPNTALPLEYLVNRTGTLQIEVEQLYWSGDQVMPAALQASLADGLLNFDLSAGHERGFKARGEVAVTEVGPIVADPLADRSGSTGVAAELTADPLSQDPASAHAPLLEARVQVDVLGDDIVLALLTAPDQEEASMPHYDLQAELTARGATLRDLAATLNGEFKLIGGRGLVNAYDAERYLGDIFRELRDTLNPSAPKEELSRQRCAVYLFQITDGTLSGVPGIVWRSKRLNLFVSGEIDLATEKIDLRLRTRPRGAIGIGAGDVVHPFTKVGGTLASPRLALDATGTAITGGLAFLTSGLSLLIKPVWDRLRRSKQPCADAIAFFETRSSSAQTADGG